MGANVKRQLPQVMVTKGDYETTAEFETRLHDRLALYVGDPDRVVFRIPINGDHQKYDADTETLTVTLPIGRPIAGFTTDTALELMANEKKVRSKVLGQTRIGVKFRYDSYVRFERFVAISDQDMRPTFGGGGSYLLESPKVELKMPRVDALLLRPSLEIVAFGSLVAPYIQSDDDSKVASLDDGYEQLTRSEVWHLKPQCAFLYDKAAKRLLYSYP